MNGKLPTVKRILWFSVLAAFAALLVPVVRACFFQYGRWLYIFLFALFLSFLLTPVMRWVARKYHVVDSPHARKIHDNSTPLLGGVAIVIAFSAALISNMILEREMMLLIAGGLVIAFVSFEDDRRELRASFKLLMQIVTVLFLIYNGIILDLFPTKSLWGYWIDLLLTLVWIVGITNAMNFLDGMDGLAAGVSVIIAGFIGIVATQTHQPIMGWIAIALVGSCFGFLPYNFKLTGKPASIFLGDTGSAYLGFTLSTLAVIGDWDSNPIVSFSAPVLIFWVLIFDMTYITLERIITGKVKSLKQWIDYVGKDHLHHRMYELLGDKRKAVLLIWFVCATLGLSAIALKHARTIDGILLVAQALLITIIISILEYSGRKRP
jgi:UDP-GlcNAc:undecaprenyl-phosphate/decaprenyl-phosphate GlcNAc-1-phosphate transferase